MSWDFLKKLVGLERDIANEKGRFSVFALVLREEMSSVVSTSDPGLSERWDLVVSAPWLSSRSKADYDYIAHELTTHIPRNDLTGISRIAIIPPSDPIVRVLRRYGTADGAVEVTGEDLENLDAKRAFVISSASAGAAVK